MTVATAAPQSLTKRTESNASRRPIKYSSFAARNNGPVASCWKRGKPRINHDFCSMKANIAAPRLPERGRAIWRRRSPHHQILAVRMISTDICASLSARIQPNPIDDSSIIEARQGSSSAGVRTGGFPVDAQTSTVVASACRRLPHRWSW
jgi:hypothetical protein